jgi:hypothetical protein
MKVEQTFIGLTANESTDRLSLQIGDPFPLDDSPSIDGVFIFPATQERRGADGFTTYNVSGYGRTSEEGYSEFTPDEIIFGVIYESGSLLIAKWSSKRKLTQRIIINNQDSEDPNNIDYDGLYTPTQIEFLPSYVGYQPSINNLKLKRFDIQRTNFGKFTELKVLSGYFYELE